MNQFDFDLEDGEIVSVEFEPVDYDDYGNIEFEIYVYNEDGKDIWHDISANDQAKIETQAKNEWKQLCNDSKVDAAINDYYSARDF